MNDPQYRPRHAAALLERALEVSPVVVPMGSRQTGKSTLVREEPCLSERLYLTLDDLSGRDRAAAAPDDLVRSAPRLVLDEVQRVPDLILAIKRAVDEDRPRRPGDHRSDGRAGAFCVTGGRAARPSAPAMGPGAREGAGRSASQRAQRRRVT